MNFGNKSSRVKPTQIIEKHNANAINYDKDKYSAYNKEKQEKKRGLFTKKHTKKKEQMTSTTSETLWREVNLFWPETIAIVGAFIAGVILMFVVRFMSATGLEMIREMLTEQAYTEVAGLISNINTLFLGVATIPFLVLIGFYMYRMFVFTPRGNKHMVARIFSTGGVRLSVDKIKDGSIKFMGGAMGEAMKIRNPKKHWLTNIGKPFIVLFEGDDSNADLNTLSGDVSEKSRDTNSVNDSMFDFGVRWERKMKEKAGAFLTPTNIILILILAGVGLALFFLLKNPETTAQLLQGPAAMVKVI